MPARPLATLFLAAVACSGACATSSRVGMFNDTVVYGGLWFEDAACASRFAAPRVVRGADVKALERCVEALHMRAGDRSHAMMDGDVLVYEPGFEVKARYLATLSAGRLLASIGFAADSRPTITVAALETLRISGSLDPGLDEADVSAVEATIKPPAKYAYMFVRVCIDDTGAISSTTTLVASSLELGGVLDRSIRDWRFRPFIWQGKARGVCSIVRFAHPAPPAKTAFVPLNTREAQYPVVAWLPHKGENRPRIDESMHKALMRTRPYVEGAVRYCIDESGAVISTEVIEPSGSTLFDDALVRTVKSWTIEPYVVNGQPVRVCSLYGFGVSYRSGNSPARPVF